MSLHCARTSPPLRLHMVSVDMLCPRSLEASWVDPFGIRNHWTSWANNLQGGLFEAEKILPSGSTQICVSFSTHGAIAQDVCKVDRHNECEWVLWNESNVAEEIWLRCTDATAFENIDVVFELVGPGSACYLQRAWNAARTSAPAGWEYWSDLGSRPSRFEDGVCIVLEAADGAAPLIEDIGNPQISYRCTTKRMCAALRVLEDVHRETLQGLVALDKRCSKQWLGSNIGNTASAGLGIASGVLAFVAPPIAIPFGIGSVLAGGLAAGGGAVAERQQLHRLRKQFSKDDWNTCAAAELIEQWSQARDSLGGCSCSLGIPPKNGNSPPPKSQATEKEEELVLGASVAVSTNSNVSTATQMVATAVNLRLPDAVLASCRVLGLAGSVLTTGLAVHGWCSTGDSQAAVREQTKALKLHIIRSQFLLAGVDRLECQICAGDVALIEDVRRCAQCLSCCHADCIPGGVSVCCSKCGGFFEEDAYTMVDSLDCFQYLEVVHPVPPIVAVPTASALGMKQQVACENAVEVLSIHDFLDCN